MSTKFGSLKQLYFAELKDMKSIWEMRGNKTLFINYLHYYKYIGFEFFILPWSKKIIKLLHKKLFDIANTTKIVHYSRTTHTH